MLIHIRLKLSLYHTAASILLIRLLLCKLPDDRVFNKGLLISDYLVARENEVVQ